MLTVSVPSEAAAMLQSIESRVLWIATNIVHHANYVRPNHDGIKVGGHQTSSASVVTLMTWLYFDFLRSGDRVSVKPHAAPVFHAIQYLLGNLERSYLPRLREFGGLQSYPSRTKDPDPVDFSTGSVGIGSIAPNFAALAHQYLSAHGWQQNQPRFVSILGDAELDEGTIWEAIADPTMQGIERVSWIVDFNRQSLDCVIPGIRAKGWQQMFRANGWNVIEVKYGRKLDAAFALPRGEIFRECLDSLSNAAYQRLLRSPANVLREWLPAKSRYSRDLAGFLSEWNDVDLVDLFRNLGGHDHEALRDVVRLHNLNEGRNVIFAYTLKGWNLPSVGHPQNHSALLTPVQMQTLREQLGLPGDDEWPAFDEQSPEGQWIAATRRRLAAPAPDRPESARIPVPPSVGCVHAGLRSTQQTFGVILTALARDFPELARLVVTVSPDVASSTNLGGWINKTGVWRNNAQEDLPADSEQSTIQWRESLNGQHVELGISESNLFMALGLFGLTHELFGQLVIPVGTLYDPFVRRGLDAFVYGVYSGGRFIVVGTPSGITLCPEGGAHQSLGCQSIGTEIPDLDSYEPCFGQELEWIFLHAMHLVTERRRSVYLRLSTRPVQQGGFPAAENAELTERLRKRVLRGGYRLIDAVTGSDDKAPLVNIFACGAMVPEALAASRLLAGEGIRANVFNLTGPGPLYRDFQTARSSGATSHLESLLSPPERRAPAVTVIDDHPHTLAWIGGALAAPVYPLGVVKFGQSGGLRDLYREYGLDSEHIAGVCRQAVAEAAAIT